MLEKTREVDPFSFTDETLLFPGDEVVDVEAL